MPDKYTDIEGLFKDAASNASGPPPPPADWAAMSSLLQESALIPSGAAAAKVGFFKALATKAIMAKVLVSTVVVGGVLTGGYLVVENHQEPNVNTAQQSGEAVGIDVEKEEATTMAYNEATQGTVNNSRAKGKEDVKQQVAAQLQLLENASKNTAYTQPKNTAARSEVSSSAGLIPVYKEPESAWTEANKIAYHEQSQENTTSHANFETAMALHATTAGKGGFSESSTRGTLPTESGPVSSIETPQKTSNTAYDITLASNPLDATLPENPSKNSTSNHIVPPTDVSTPWSPAAASEATSNQPALAATTSSSPVENTQESTEAIEGITGNAGVETSTEHIAALASQEGAGTTGADSAQDQSVPKETEGTATENMLATQENPSAESTGMEANSMDAHLTLKAVQSKPEATTATGEGAQPMSATDTEASVTLTKQETAATNNNSIEGTGTAPKLNESTEPLIDSTSVVAGQAASDSSYLQQGVELSQTTEEVQDSSASGLEPALATALDSALNGVDSAALLGNIAMRPEEPKWLISPYFSIDRSTYAIDAVTLNNLAGSTRNLQIGSSSGTYTGGIRAAYNIAPYLWFESGFLYSRKSGIKGTMELFDQDNNITALANYQLSGEFYEIPISLGVRGNNGYFGWYFKAGVHLAYNRATDNSYFEYYDLDQEKVFTIRPSTNTLNPAITAAAGFEYNITRQLRFYAEPSFRLATRPMLNTNEFDNVPLNPKWNTIGLGIGINYYFGKK